MVVKIVLKVAYCGIVDEPRGNVQVTGVRDAARVEERPPCLDHLGSVFLVKWTSVGQEGGGEQNVSNQPVGKTLFY